MDDKECSKLGGGLRRRVPVVAIDKRVPELAYDYDEQFHHQHDGVTETFGNCVGAWPEIVDKYDLRKMLLEYTGSERTFFYHSDHLGSAAYLTSGGQVTQTLNYLPYGEDWVDVRNNLDSRLGAYNFNGKEKDYESGFHYYGARYYWSELLTGWLSVDPLADKYPSISPYAYCAWNSMILVDLDGAENIIYIVNLQKDKVSIDVNKLINETNQRFEKLGLETRVMHAPDGANFDPQYMDKTDSYTVIGGAYDVREFISSKGNHKSISSWKGGTSNPERAENNYTKKGDYIAIDASGLKSVANNLGFDKVEMAALTILHGAGHNAGFNHSDEPPKRFDQNSENAAIMISGSGLKGRKNKGLNYIMNPNQNTKYTERMQTVFGTKKAHSNYENKKNAKQHPYIAY